MKDFDYFWGGYHRHPKREIGPTQKIPPPPKKKKTFELYETCGILCLGFYLQPGDEPVRNSDSQRVYRESTQSMGPKDMC